MKRTIITFITISLLISCQKHSLTSHVYGEYADWSHYTEVVLNKDSSYRYVDLPFNGPAIRESGHWSVKNGLLTLDEGQTKRVFRIKQNEICPKNNEDIPCLSGRKESVNPN